MKREKCRIKSPVRVLNSPPPCLCKAGFPYHKQYPLTPSLLFFFLLFLLLHFPHLSTFATFCISFCIYIHTHTHTHTLSQNLCSVAVFLFYLPLSYHPGWLTRHPLLKCWGDWQRLETNTDKEKALTSIRGMEMQNSASKQVIRATFQYFRCFDYHRHDLVNYLGHFGCSWWSCLKAPFSLLQNYLSKVNLTSSVKKISQSL